MSQKNTVYCHEKYTELVQICHCEEGEEKGRPEQLPLVRGPETTLSPSHHMHLPSQRHTAFVYFVSSRAWNGPCCFCLPIQIAQKRLSILQKCWKSRTLEHSKVSEVYPVPFSNGDLSFHYHTYDWEIGIFLTVPESHFKGCLFFSLLKVVWIFFSLLTACATEPSLE